MNTPAPNRINRVHVRVAIYVLAVPVLLLYTLVLCGSISVSPGIPKKFLAKIQLAQGFKDGRVQFGYFAVCAENLNFSKSLTCMPSYSVSVDTLSAAVLGEVDIDHNSTTQFESLNSTADATTSVHSLVNVTLDLQRHILVSPFVAGAILFFAAITTLLLVKVYERSGTTPEKLESSQRKISYLVPITLFFAWLSTVIAFTGALLTTEAITSLRFVTERDGGNLIVSTGTALGVLQWLIHHFIWSYLRINRAEDSSQRRQYVDCRIKRRLQQLDM